MSKQKIIDKETQHEISEKPLLTNWELPENQETVNQLILMFGIHKKIQVIGYDGESRYFLVETKQIITEGIKAQDLLAKKYGQEISREEYEKI
jgi:hypothetical protein